PPRGRLRRAPSRAPRNCRSTGRLAEASAKVAVKEPIATDLRWMHYWRGDRAGRAFTESLDSARACKGAATLNPASRFRAATACRITRGSTHWEFCWDSSSEESWVPRVYSLGLRTFALTAVAVR